MTDGIAGEVFGGCGNFTEHVIKIAAESAARDEGFPVALTLLSGDGVKLVRGFYVIVPMSDGDSEPRWSRYHLEQAEGRWALHDDNREIAPFEHFVLRIDYAKA